MKIIDGLGYSADTPSTLLRCIVLDVAYIESQEELTENAGLDNDGRVLSELVGNRNIITARRYASAVYAVVVFVRLSVRPSQVGTVPKRLMIESREQRRAITQGL